MSDEILKKEIADEDVENADGDEEENFEESLDVPSITPEDEGFVEELEDGDELVDEFAKDLDSLKIDPRTLWDWRKLIPSGIIDPVTNNEIRTTVTARRKYRDLNPEKKIYWVDQQTEEKIYGPLKGAPNYIVTQMIAQDFADSSDRSRHEFGPGKYNEVLEIRLKSRTDENYFNLFVSSIKDGYIDILKLPQVWKKPKKSIGKIEPSGIVDSDTKKPIWVSTRTRRLFRSVDKYNSMDNKELNVVIANIFSSSGPPKHIFKLNDNNEAGIRESVEFVGKYNIFIAKRGKGVVTILTIQDGWKRPDRKDRPGKKEAGAPSWYR